MNFTENKSARALPFLFVIVLQRHKKWLSVLLLIMMLGCGTAEEKDAGKSTKTTSEAENADTSAEKIEARDATTFYSPGVLAKLDDETRKDPAKVYSVLCAQCHGLNGEPVFPGAPNLKELTCPKRAITGTIYSGRGPMPSFANVLTRPEISRLADYVQKMQQPHE